MKRESCYVEYNTQLCSLWTTSSLSAVFAPGLISFLFSRQFKYLHLNHPHLQSWKQWTTNYRYFHQSWECFYLWCLIISFPIWCPIFSPSAQIAFFEGGYTPRNYLPKCYIRTKLMETWRKKKSYFLWIFGLNGLNTIDEPKYITKGRFRRLL